MGNELISKNKLPQVVQFLVEEATRFISVEPYLYAPAGFRMQWINTFENTYRYSEARRFLGIKNAKKYAILGWAVRRTWVVGANFDTITKEEEEMNPNTELTDQFWEEIFKEYQNPPYIGNWETNESFPAIEVDKIEKGKQMPILNEDIKEAWLGLKKQY